MKYLLDVNALISAIWQNHANYPRMAAWMNNKSLAVCPISEMGFLRISTSKSFGLSMNEAKSALEKFNLETGAAFIPDSFSALEHILNPALR
jgi:predicted nucleic acid-binding protein